MNESQKPMGKAKGGHARAESLTPEKRAEIASIAARKRWEQREVSSNIPKTISGLKGEINLGGVKLPCAVIQGSSSPW